MKTTILAVVCVPVIAALVGCGENIAPPPVDLSPYYPRQLSALSVDASTVALRWVQPEAVNDAILAGYIIRYAGRRDTVTKTTTDYLASSLLPGIVSFVISPLATDGRTADGTSLLWAPADRFDAPAYVLYEYNVADLSRNAGLNVGTRLTDPSTIPVAAAAQESMDLILNGDAGLPLRFQSAHLVTAGWNVTLLSTISHPSNSLERYLESYPPDSSFTQAEVVLQNNTVYYAIAEGDLAGERNYVRIHVRLLPGAFPNRSIEVTISLQREVSVPFASLLEGEFPLGGGVSVRGRS